MKTKKNIEDMQTLASKHGGVCLSTEYINTATKLWWQCSEGHEWEAAPSSVQQGHWCPQCANKRIGEDLRYSIENMQDLAIKRGGMCLSFEYIDNKTKLRWQCGFCGHKWEARPANIKKGNWCPTCGRKKSDLARRRYSIGDMHDLAVRKNGKCLSPEYLGAHAKLKWRCSKGHEWEARPNAIRRGNWCPTCSGKRKKTIDAMQEVARDRGGECLSAQYTNCKNKLQWRCAKGHEWEATPDNIVQGKWCPYCAGKRKPVQSEKQIHNQQAKQLCLF
jgi:Zn finger protein HypA/HybF involved in hydrogenase expression